VRPKVEEGDSEQIYVVTSDSNAVSPQISSGVLPSRAAHVDSVIYSIQFAADPQDLSLSVRRFLSSTRLQLRSRALTRAGL
jgi:hypothetical protein